jgi:ATP-dependent exoDNAse (exonuclease V) beta subunit
MGQPAEKMRDDTDDDLADVARAWERDIRQRVDDIRNGTGHWPVVEELLAELDQYMDEAETDEEDDEDEDEDEDDPAEVEAAWAEEIQRRVEEIRSGTVKTYAAEDVFAALRLRFG